MRHHRTEPGAGEATCPRCGRGAVGVAAQQVQRQGGRDGVHEQLPGGPSRACLVPQRDRELPDERVRGVGETRVLGAVRTAGQPDGDVVEHAGAVAGLAAPARGDEGHGAGEVRARVPRAAVDVCFRARGHATERDEQQVLVLVAHAFGGRACLPARQFEAESGPAVFAVLQVAPARVACHGPSVRGRAYG